MREYNISEKIARELERYWKDNTTKLFGGKYYGGCSQELADKILSLLHSEMVGLIPAEKRVSKLGNLAENDRNEGYNLLRSELLSAIEKKFGEAL